MLHRSPPSQPPAAATGPAGSFAGPDREAAVCAAYLDRLPDGHMAAFRQASVLYGALFGADAGGAGRVLRLLAACMPGCLEAGRRAPDAERRLRMRLA